MQPPGSLVGHLSVLSRFQNVRGPSRSWGYAADRATWGPPVIVFLALKRLVPPRRHGLCSQPPNSGPLLISSAVVKYWRTPMRNILGNHTAHLWATFHFVPRSKVLDTPQEARVM